MFKYSYVSINSTSSTFQIYMLQLCIKLGHLSILPAEIIVSAMTKAAFIWNIEM